MPTKKYKYSYPQNRKLAKQLMHGERKIISKLMHDRKLKYSYGYLKQVLQGVRKNKEITDFVKEYIQNRNELLKLFK